MYLEQVNYELNKKINDFVCNSNDATTPPFILSFLFALHPGAFCSDSISVRSEERRVGKEC